MPCVRTAVTPTPRCLLLTITAVLAAGGCVSTKAPEQTALMQGMNVNVSAQRMRVADHNFARNFMTAVELTADSVARLTDDPVVRHNTLVWKSNAIPAIQLALYHPDPLVSFADGWILLVQMRQYFESGGGKDAFGEQQGMVVDRLREGEAELKSVAAGDDHHLDQIQTFVYDWAEEHPLTNDRYLRRSPTEAVADLLASGRGGGFSSLGSMTEMAQDAQQMALVLASYTPKQIAWQSELLMADMTDSVHLAPVLHAIDDMEVVSATADFMRVAPDLIAAERAAVFKEIAAERLQTFRDIDALRRQAFADVSAMIASERAASLREVGAMLAAGRSAMLAGMGDLTSQAFDETRELINHLMMWLAVLGLGLAVTFVVGAILYRKSTAA